MTKLKTTLLLAGLMVGSTAQAAPLDQATQLQCEIVTHVQVGTDGQMTEALFPSIGEMIDVDMTAGTMAGIGWNDLALGPNVLLTRDEAAHYMAYSLTEPNRNGAGEPFQNMKTIVVDFASGTNETAPFMATLNGTEIITGVCRGAGGGA